MNELTALRESLLFGWALLPTADYLKRLAALWAAVFVVPAGPIAAATFDPLAQPAEFALAGAAGAMLVVLAAVLRIYLGWSYVGNRRGHSLALPTLFLVRDRLFSTFAPHAQKCRASLRSGAHLFLPRKTAAQSRLLSATIEYEETGWYDGQLWTKPPEVLARDRLLGTYEVRPCLGRLKATLAAASAGLLGGGVALTLLIRSPARPRSSPSN